MTSHVSAFAVQSFLETLGPVHHQIDSYNRFVDQSIRDIIRTHGHLAVTHKGITYEVDFGDVVFNLPLHYEINGTTIDLTPKMCLDRDMTYMAEMLLDFSVKMPRGMTQYHERVPMGFIPVMVMSSLCRLTALRDDPSAMIALGEDIHDPGGYFIIQGQPKVVACREQMVVNRIYTFDVKSSKRRGALHGEVRNTAIDSYRETIFKTDLFDGTFLCSLPYIKESFPVSVVFYLLGISDPTLMLHLILPQEEHLAIPGLLDRASEVLQKTLEHSHRVTSEQEAWHYLCKIGRKVIVQDAELESHKTSILDNAHRLIDIDLFPQMGQGSEYRYAKACFLGLFLRQILYADVGHKPRSDDRDHMALKSMITPGMALTTLFSQVFLGLLRDIRSAIIKSIDAKDTINLKTFLFTKKEGIKTAMINAIKNNRWNLNKEKIAGLSQTLDKFNYVAGLQATRKTLKLLAKDSGLAEKPRELHGSQYQAVCPASSPEGKKVGFVGEYGAVGTVSVGEPGRPIITLIQSLPMVHSMTEIQRDPTYLGDTPILVNGALVGTTPVPDSLVSTLRRLKRSSNLHCETGIIYQKEDHEIHISTQAGRIIRPCLVIQEGVPVLASLVIPDKVNAWWYMITHGAVEWISKDEEEQVTIASRVEDITLPDAPCYDYAELGAENMYGLGAATIPFPEHNAAPRNSFQVAQGKQAIGVPGTNAMMRTDHRVYVLNQPNRPLAHTRNAESAHITDLPSGTNAVVMVYPMEGFNQEDSLVLNSASISMGFAAFTLLTPYSSVIRGNEKETLEIPSRETCTNFHGNASKLDPKLFHVLRGQRVERGDLLIGLVSRRDGTAKSISPKYDHELPGTVYRVFVCHNADGYVVIRIIVAQYRPLECSDKMSLPCGNKGTVSMIYSPVDLPQTLSGLIPEVLVNPLAFPSRMSFGIFFEALTGRKLASKLADQSMATVFKTSRDATPFQSDVTLERLMDELHAAGIPRCSEERVIDGRTGEMTSVPVFIGLNHYQRLKHLGVDKINCLTMDHEVLTDSGWKFFPQLTLHDKIATLDHGKLVYAHPTALHHYHYEGEMYHIVKIGHLDLKVTKNHRMYVSQREDDTWGLESLVTAETIMGKPVRYKKDAVWDAPDYQFILPEVRIGCGYHDPPQAVPMVQWLVLFGIWVARPGFTGVDFRQSRVTIICGRRTRKILIEMSRCMGLYRDDCDDKQRVTFQHGGMAVYLGSLLESIHEQLPSWVWQLSRQQCRRLLYGMKVGQYEGNSTPLDSDIETKEESYVCHSSRFADDMVRLLLHCGWSGTKMVYHRFERLHGISTLVGTYWVVTLERKNTPRVNVSGLEAPESEHVTTEKCPVFCVSVPSEVFYVRRNGIPIWTGNSRAKGQRDRLTQQPVEGRAHGGGQRCGVNERPSGNERKVSASLEVIALRQHFQIQGKSVMLPS